MNDYLQQEYYDNTVLEYLIVAGSILIGLAIVALFKRTVLRYLRNWANKSVGTLDDYIVENIDKFVVPAVNVTIVYTALRTLSLNEKLLKALIVAYTVVLTYFIIRLISRVLRMMLQAYVRKQENGEEKVKQISGILLIINMVIWSIGLIFLFDNLGYDVTTILTGLGIGGIAIALAAQNILGDLFNYFVIFFDRPFEIGDFLVIDNKNGVVEKIGIKTTRIATLSGEQLVMANSDLTSSRIHNYKKMKRRRIVQVISVARTTTLEQLRIIPSLIREVASAQDQVTVDRSHFRSFGESGYEFETVYYVEVPDYTYYMDVQQNINLGICAKFEELGIALTYPTRALFMQNATANFKVAVDKTGGDDKTPDLVTTKG